LEKLYSGISLACKNFKVDLVGGDTCSSVQGLSISITALGQVSKEKITYRSGANPNDILMVSGNLGAAYMGLQVLEREKAVFQVNPKSQPDLSKYSYCVERQLKPEGRKDVIEILDGLGIIPTSMIDISDGLSSEILHLSKASKLGCTIYEDKIPIDQEVINTAEEFRFNSITAALNGGEDYEILFTIRQEDYEKIKSNNLVSAIGHMTKKNLDCYMENNLDRKMKLVAQGWKNF
jgi:thiamine-monophosphate kinase